MEDFGLEISAALNGSTFDQDISGNRVGGQFVIPSDYYFLLTAEPLQSETEEGVMMACGREARNPSSTLGTATFLTYGGGQPHAHKALLGVQVHHPSSLHTHTQA